MDILGGYEQDDLEADFKLVHNKENWKMEIDAVVPAELVEDVNRLSFAVMFFTGDYPDIETIDSGKFYHVRGAGYYNIIGA